ncbi:MAG: hypothetical protein IJ524_04230 [Bacteroidales bacterium]|nr:hypothetical protein [Bacteroidales bacterium]
MAEDVGRGEGANGGSVGHLPGARRGCVGCWMVWGIRIKSDIGLADKSLEEAQSQ